MCPKINFFRTRIVPHSAPLGYFSQTFVDTLPSAAQCQCQGTFFLEGNFTTIFEAKKLSTIEQKFTKIIDPIKSKDYYYIITQKKFKKNTRSNIKILV